MQQTSYWVGVASADHVARGRAGGFMQVCHGKAAPLRRIRPADGVIYYSPVTSFGGADGLQSFTAIGFAADMPPYTADMGGGFVPHRRDVLWADATPARIRPLLDRLHLTQGRTNWGYGFRFGLLSISAHDFAVIAAAMDADIGVAASDHIATPARNAQIDTGM